MHNFNLTLFYTADIALTYWQYATFCNFLNAHFVFNIDLLQINDLISILRYGRVFDITLIFWMTCSKSLVFHYLHSTEFLNFKKVFYLILVLQKSTIFAHIIHYSLYFCNYV